MPSSSLIDPVLIVPFDPSAEAEIMVLNVLLFTITFNSAVPAVACASKKRSKFDENGIVRFKEAIGVAALFSPKVYVDDTGNISFVVQKDPFVLMTQNGWIPIESPGLRKKPSASRL